MGIYKTCLDKYGEFGLRLFVWISGKQAWGNDGFRAALSKD